MPRGRKKLSSETLRNNGAKPHRWKARLALEQAAPGIPAATTAWLDAARKEDQTYSSRCIPGESICRVFGGKVFTWPPHHYLTLIRDLCQQIVSDATYKWPETKAECTEFLEDLSTGATRNIFTDPESAASISLCFATFAPGESIYLLTLFDLVRFFALRTATGDYVLDDGELLGFAPEIITMLDKAFLALRCK